MKKLILILVFILAACKAPQPTLKTEVVRTDIQKTKVIERPPILSTLILEEICDTVTGKPKTIYKNVVVGKDTVFIKLKDNALQLRYNLAAMRLQQLDSINRAQKEALEKVEVVKVWPWRLITALGAVIVAFILFPGLPKGINKGVRYLVGLV